MLARPARSAGPLPLRRSRASPPSLLPSSMPPILPRTRPLRASRAATQRIVTGVHGAIVARPERGDRVILRGSFARQSAGVENVARHAAAAFLVAAIVGACGTPAPTPTESPSAGPTPTPAASSTTTAVLSTPTPTTSPPTQTAALSLGSTPEVPFAGDTVTLTIDAYLARSTT